MTLLDVIDASAGEVLLFAAVGFVIGGLDDLAIDLLFAWRSARRAARGGPRFSAADFTLAEAPGRMAVFVPAWDEAEVIGAMLTALLDRYDYPHYTVFVGAYPNDPGTIAQVAVIAERDPRVRLVIGARPGPTTKADCLNTLWQALLRDEAHGGTAKAVVLHDAEDLVHPAELRIFDWLIGRHAAVQLPVLPLIDPRGRLVSGCYADEFAESHAKQLQVREALGVGLPLAGVGCAIARDWLARIAKPAGPFDAASLTEDYELGLALG
ncbi:MAG: glycosyltransferase, partial [Sphingomonas sp.]|nr:glycosyltransferase [Sphingomonas sp.]